MSTPRLHRLFLLAPWRGVLRRCALGGSRLALVVGAGLCLCLGACARPAVAQSEAQPGALPPLVISELRAWGPGGREDSFVELQNTTPRAIESAGWRLRLRTSRGPVEVSLPARVRIPAYGHFLVVGRGYTLQARAPGDFTIAQPVSGGVQLRDPQGRLVDAAGPEGAPAEFREGKGLPRAAFVAPQEAASQPQCSCVRKVAQGRVLDTADNARDFAIVSVSGLLGAQPVRLGAPGPDGSASPVLRPRPQSPERLPAALEPSVRARKAVRDSEDRGADRALGTLDLSCRVKNTTARPLKDLTFQVDGITAGASLAGASRSSLADVRLLRAEAATPAASAPRQERQQEEPGAESEAASTCTAALEEPPAQLHGGGLNARATAKLPGGLAPGAWATVRFRLGVVRAGRYRVALRSDLLSVTFNGHTEAGLNSDAPDGPGVSARTQAQSAVAQGGGRRASIFAGAPSAVAPVPDAEPDVWTAAIVLEGNTEDGVPDGGPPSPLQVSSLAAQPDASALTLRFRSKLGSQGAPSFEVLVNGAAVSPEGISYSADRTGVRLALPAGSLRPGDVVLVKWKGLRDADGLLSTGQVGPIKAT